MPINETASVTNCDTNFEPLIENLKLFLQLCYLTPSALFLSRVIYITAWKYRKKFRKQRFYTIFLADCVTVSKETILYNRSLYCYEEIEDSKNNIFKYFTRQSIFRVLS